MSYWEQKSVSLVDGADFLRRYLSVLMILLASSFCYFFWSTGRTAMAIPVAGATLGGIAALAIIRKSDFDRLFDEPVELEQDTILFLTQPKLAVSIAFLYIATVLVLHTVSLYERPTISYVLHGAIFAYISLCIYYQSNKIVTLLQLLPVAFVTYWSSQLIFPSGTSRVGRYWPRGQTIFAEGSVPQGITYGDTPGFFILSGAFQEITTLVGREGHLLVAVLIVTGPIAILLCLDRVFPSISQRMAQYTAVTYATAAYTINRGVLPHTTSFFYIHTGIVVIALFAVLFGHVRFRYALIGWLLLLAATVGHTFSGGAPLVVLLMTTPLVLTYLFVYRSRIDLDQLRPVSLFALIYAVAFFGYEIYVRGANEVFRRASATILSLHSFLTPAADGGGSGGGTGGTTGGFYSELSIELLIQATAGEIMLFFLGFGGLCVLAYRNRFDLDMVVLWIGGGFLLLALAVILVSDIPAHRFYQILVIFGINIAAGAMIFMFAQASGRHYRSAVLISVVFIFAVFSLMSPIAGMAMTPLTDEFPTDDGLYDTAYDNANNQWNSEYVSQQMSWSSIPLSKINSTTATIDRERLESGDTFQYSSNHANTGKGIGSASDLGGAERTLLEWNSKLDKDHQVYTNGKSKTVIRR